MAKSSNPATTILAGIVIVAAIVIAIFLGSKSSSNSGTPTVSADDPVLGPKDAKVTITEFSDFECPACEQLFHTILPQLESKYKDRVRFVYKQFPLPQHTSGKQAAIASVCAQDQNKFWEFRDKIVADYPKWTENNSLIDEYAKAIGLDMTKYNSCKKSKAPQEKIDKDMDEGEKRGVNATPTLFVNDKKIVGVEDLSVYEKTIDDMLK